MGLAAKKVRVRQDRFEVDGDLLWFDLGSTRFTVLDFSRYGLAATCEADRAPTSFSGLHIELYYREQPLGPLQLVERRRQPKNDLLEINFEVLGDPIPVEQVQLVMETATAMQMHETVSDRLSKIPIEFRHQVYAFVNWLARLEPRVQDLEMSYQHLPRADFERCETTVVQMLSGAISAHFATQQEPFSHAVQGADSVTLREAFLYFSGEVLRLLQLREDEAEASTFETYLSNEIKTKGELAFSDLQVLPLFSKCVLQALVSEPLEAAEAERTQILGQLLRQLSLRTKKGGHVLAYGTRGGHRLRRVFESDDNLRTFPFCFEFWSPRLDSLKEVQRVLLDARLKQGSQATFEFLQKEYDAVVNESDSDTQDLIYSFGFLDYFDDDFLSCLVPALLRCLRKGGHLVLSGAVCDAAAFMQSPVNTDRALVYRTEGDYQQLFARLGMPFEVQENGRVGRYFVWKK